MSVLWLLVGSVVAIVAGLSIRWTVGILDPRAPSRAIAMVIGGLVVRVAVAALVLAVALRQGITEGVLAFVGLWLGRWGAVMLLSRGSATAGASIP